MYYFTPATIAQANNQISSLDAKVGGLLCILSCLDGDINENVNYEINGTLLRRQLSMVFDKTPRDTFDNVRSSYIIFARNWSTTFFNRYIRNRIDLTACAVFFLRRKGFERELTEDEIIDIFISQFNLQPLRDQWFFKSEAVSLEFNQSDVEHNQTEFYSLMNYSNNFESILFDKVIQNSATSLKAAGQIQTLYSGSGIQTCLLLSDEPLDQYYIMNNSEIPDGAEANNVAEQTEAVDYNEQKTRFRSWLLGQTKANGEPYSQGTINNYLYCMERGYQLFERYNGFVSPFQIQDVVSADEYTTYLFNAEGFEEFNINNSYKSCECGWAKYKEFLMEQAAPYVEPVYETSLDKDFPRNRIFFGAPGTGKSFTINQDKDLLLGENNESDYERVTFHPDYSYASFVGTYKPVPKKNDSISYEYVPGPFMRVYVKAILNGRSDNVKPFLLIIEEINRANVAAVFGDVFQLLDRDKNGVSEYPIQVSQDARIYLASELGGKPDDYSSIRIPNNMFIWATMNSADQGVYPMDTAFKRRWSFKYIGIDNNEEKIADKEVTLELSDGSGEKQTFKWNDLRKAINNMLGVLRINEDKMLGTFFISLKDLGDSNVIDPAVFRDIFESKVLMYLFEDAARQRRDELFEGSITDNKTLRYSDLCDDFDKRGVRIFNEKIYKPLEK